MATGLNTGIRLGTLKKGAKGIVTEISDEQAAGRMMAMGILIGSEVTMIRKSPFGGACYVKVDNLLIALRKTEANSILLK
ncbi:MAG: FeoA family protein [Bacteroidota bacterium]